MKKPVWLIMCLSAGGVIPFGIYALFTKGVLLGMCTIAWGVMSIVCGIILDRSIKLKREATERGQYFIVSGALEITNQHMDMIREQPGITVGEILSEMQIVANDLQIAQDNYLAGVMMEVGNG